MAKTHKSLDTINSISVDGEPKNTGPDSGLVRCFEEHVNRPIQRIVCISHGVELVFRKFFESVGNSKFQIRNFRAKNECLLLSLSFFMLAFRKNFRAKTAVRIAVRKIHSYFICLNFLTKPTKELFI